MGDDYLVPVLVRLHPTQLHRLLVVQQAVDPEEAWDKTIGDAIQIALDRYATIAERARQRKAGELRTQLEVTDNQ